MLFTLLAWSTLDKFQPLAKKYTEFKQRMPKNARKFNFKNFETDNPNSMYHNEFLPYRTAIPKEP